jgi:hypothetical protein
MVGYLIATALVLSLACLVVAAVMLLTAVAPPDGSEHFSAGAGARRLTLAIFSSGTQTPQHATHVMTQAAALARRKCDPAAATLEVASYDVDAAAAHDAMVEFRVAAVDVQERPAAFLRDDADGTSVRFLGYPPTCAGLFAWLATVSPVSATGACEELTQGIDLEHQSDPGKRLTGTAVRAPPPDLRYVREACRDAGFFAIKNAGDGSYLHAADATATAGSIKWQPSWAGGDDGCWRTVTDAGCASGFARIESKSQPGLFLRSSGGTDARLATKADSAPAADLCWRA